MSDVEIKNQIQSIKMKKALGIETELSEQQMKLYLDFDSNFRQYVSETTLYEVSLKNYVSMINFSGRIFGTFAIIGN